MKKVLIIGAGASGLMAAIAAAEKGAQVTVLEQNDRPARKLLATGNGRCNFSHADVDIQAYPGGDPAFLETAFRQYDAVQTLSFFQKIGVFPVEKNGCFYPRSMQAGSVAELLMQKAACLKVKIKTREKVCSIHKSEDGSWHVATDSWTYSADAVILACGSKASRISGSDGSGYALAKDSGHHIITPLPALIGLKCRGKAFSGWAGVRTEGTVSLFLDKNLCCRETGELQLTEYGVSGIPVFQISSRAVRALYDKKEVSLHLDFLPEFSKKDLADYQSRAGQECPSKTDRELLLGLLPDKLIKVLLKESRPFEAAKEYSLTVTGSMPFEQAQVCSGGVDTDEINPRTMESRLCKGLFFCGELMNIDGICGGYNLQWAWTSGAIAGRCAAEELPECTD